jgi:hypothetical protein
MTKEQLIEYFDEGKNKEEFLEYLRKITDEFFDKYSKKYPKMKEDEYLYNDAMSHVVEKLDKYRNIWEERGNHDNMAKHMLLYYCFAGTPQSTIDKWKGHDGIHNI